MMKEKGWYRRNLSVGPGGMRCPCCAPCPGPWRRQVLRAIRKRNRIDIERELEREYLSEVSSKEEDVE